jgi:hypothetical protein
MISSFMLSILLWKKLSSAMLRIEWLGMAQGWTVGCGEDEDGGWL